VRSWLRSRSKKDDSNKSVDPGIELLVLEGADTGQSFTVDADVAYLGRNLDDAELRGGITLRDSTVSSRHALIRRQNGAHTIEHLPEARNPTLVNGSIIESAVLVPGSQIQLGRVVIEVRSQAGTGLADLTQLFVDKFSAPQTPAKIAGSGVEGDNAIDTEQLEVLTTELSVGTSPSDFELESSPGRLVVRESAGDFRGTRHPLRPPKMLLGRATNCHVHIKNLGVSRRHAEIVWESDALVLRHLSSTNLTSLNGREVKKPTILRSGDKIVLAGRVEITLELNQTETANTLVTGETSAREAERTSMGGSVDSGLREAMEQKVALNQKIIEEFTVEGSFLDVDVVNSHGMKVDISEPEAIIVSFERFRIYVAAIVKEFDGHVLNSNGDELMCFFESPQNAINSGMQMLERLDKFNTEENLLEKPFRFRIGVHSGRSLVDLKRGVAYSAVLDVAGHLQKYADTNGMAISDHTLAAIGTDHGPQPLTFRSGGFLERENFEYHLLIRAPSN
jgi:pSer/pThr/pTyr-binding forkhead associated (FHA) protein